NHGQPTDISPAEASGPSTFAADPPPGGTRKIAWPSGAENRIASLPHVPKRPVPSVTSHSVTTAPLERSSRLTRPLEKNAIDRLAGDQNTEVAPSVAGTGFASRVASGRSQILLRPAGSVATNASCEPSGDNARPVVSMLTPTPGAPKAVPGGGEIVNCTVAGTGPVAMFGRRRERPEMTAKTTKSTPEANRSGCALICATAERFTWDSNGVPVAFSATAADSDASSRAFETPGGS